VERDARPLYAAKAVDPEAKREQHRLWKRTYRKRKKAVAEAAIGNGNGESVAPNNGLDAYGFPIGTRDAQGRKLGQLDDLYIERSELEANLARYTERSVALEKEKYAVPLPKESDTLEQEINTKARLLVINELIADNDAKIKTTENAINAKNARIEKLEAEYETAKKNRDEYSKGGRIYKDKVAYAEFALNDAEQKKRAAKATLEGKSVEYHSEARVQLRCANDNIAKYSTIEGWLDEQRQKYEDEMKIYRR